MFVLKAQPHPTFERSGNDLLTHATITLSEALLGFSRILLKHLDGRGIKVSSPPRKIIKPETCIIARGEGMPVYKSHGQRGDLYVIISIEMPDEAWLRRVDRQVKINRLGAAIDLLGSCFYHPGTSFFATAKEAGSRTIPRNGR